MTGNLREFGETARGLAKNPLGIIALFIVLVYGFASLVTAFSGSLTAAERLPLVYFLVIFPVLVLGVFAWLVSRHSGKLFAPSDFRDEANYVKMQQQQMAVVASLSAATAKTQTQASEFELENIIELARTVSVNPTRGSETWRNHVLWVDDRPNNNTYERKAFEAIGLRFTLAQSTEEAVEELGRERFVAIISDMGRREGPREGYVLLDRLREQGDRTPLFFYAASNAPEHEAETRKHGGQGCTNNAQDLFQMVARTIVGRQAA